MAAAATDTATEDQRWLVIDGRRWRRSDPSIPDQLRAQLVRELMAARRAVRDAGGDPDALRAARARVQDAKVALGERGPKWWEPATAAGQAMRVDATIRALLRSRAEEATICPSDAARAACGSGWRARMDAVRARAFALQDDGVVEVRRSGEVVTAADYAGGPLRIARGPRFGEEPPLTTNESRA